MGDQLQEHQFSMADAKNRAYNSRVKGLLYGGDPDRAFTPIKTGKHRTPQTQVAAAPFAVIPESSNQAQHHHPNAQTSYNALNIKNREGAAKPSAQDYGSAVYAANRVHNYTNQANARQHASQGAGNFLAFDPYGGAGGPVSPRAGDKVEEWAAPVDDISTTYTAISKSKDKQLMGKIGAYGHEFDVSIYAINRVTNMEKKNAIATHNRGMANLITN